MTEEIPQTALLAFVEKLADVNASPGTIQYAAHLLLTTGVSGGFTVDYAPEPLRPPDP